MLRVGNNSRQEMETNKLAITMATVRLVMVKLATTATKPVKNKQDKEPDKTKPVQAYVHLSPSAFFLN